jgi:hypothetical protein
MYSVMAKGYFTRLRAREVRAPRQSDLRVFRPLLHFFAALGTFAQAHLLWRSDFHLPPPCLRCRDGTTATCPEAAGSCSS